METGLNTVHSRNWSQHTTAWKLVSTRHTIEIGLNTQHHGHWSQHNRPSYLFQEEVVDDSSFRLSSSTKLDFHVLALHKTQVCITINPVIPTLNPTYQECLKITHPPIQTGFLHTCSSHPTSKAMICTYHYQSCYPNIKSNWSRMCYDLLHWSRFPCNCPKSSTTKLKELAVFFIHLWVNYGVRVKNENKTKKGTTLHHQYRPVCTLGNIGTSAVMHLKSDIRCFSGRQFHAEQFPTLVYLHHS